MLHLLLKKRRSRDCERTLSMFCQDYSERKNYCRLIPLTVEYLGKSGAIQEIFPTKHVRATELTEDTDILYINNGQELFVGSVTQRCPGVRTVLFPNSS